MRQTDYVILGLLSEAPMTGYQIKRVIDLRFRFFWNESYGQLYPALRSLASSGYVEEIAEDAVKKRAQKTYRLTAAGLAALRDWLAQPVEKESIRLEILLKMYFSYQTDPAVMLGHVARFKEVHERDLAMLLAFERELEVLREEDPAHPTVLRVIDFGIKANRAYLDWCRETAEFLKGRES